MSRSKPEICLSDVTWLTALARTLTRDPGEADDLAQETVLVACRTPPPGGRVPRPWLATVLRRLHLRSLRLRRGRLHRERDAARPEELVDTAELVGRAELRRVLADSLLAMEESHRTILMRVAFEGQTTSQLAQREGVSPSVIRRRLRKARELYEARLERSYGKAWSWWSAALLPYARLPLPPELGAAALGAKSPIFSASSLGGALMTAKVIVSVVVLLGLCALFWIMSLPDTAYERPPTMGETAMHETGSSEVASRGRTSEGGPEVRRAVQADVGVDAVRTAATKGDQGAALVEGRFRLVTDHGSLLENLSGQAAFKVWCDVAESPGYSNEIEPITFEVVGGRFRRGIDRGSVDRPEPQSQAAQLGFGGEVNAWLELVSLVLDGFHAAPVPGQGFEGRFRLPVAPLVIDVQWLRPLTLNVKDAATGFHLDGVTIIPGGTQDVVGRDYPLHQETLVTGASSPIRLEPPFELAKESRAILHVTAPGYAWTRVVLNPRIGGEQEALLQPGGSVEVILDDPVGEMQFLQIWRGQPTLSTLPELEEQVGEFGRLRIDGLQAGEHTVQATQGPYFPGDDRAVGSASFVITPGELVVARLRFDPRRKHGEARLAGTLSIDPRWLDLVMSLVVQRDGAGPRIVVPISEMERLAGHDGSYRWDVGYVLPGAWSIFLEEMPVGIRVQLEAAGVSNAHLEVPTPATLCLSVVDERTGAALSQEDCSLAFWSPVANGGRWSAREHVKNQASGRVAQRDPRTGIIELVVPVGEVDVKALAIRHGSDWQRLRVRPGRNDATLVVRASVRLVVELFDGDRRVPLPEPLERLHLEAIDGAGEVRILARGTSEGQEFIDLAHPGRYRLTLPPVPGYAPVGVQEFELRSGQTVRHRIELKPR